jgi:hypothetical protein
MQQFVGVIAHSCGDQGDQSFYRDDSSMLDEQPMAENLAIF